MSKVPHAIGATPDAPTQPVATAELRDIFALTGHGTVLILGNWIGTVRIGATLQIADSSAQVTAIESIRFADTARHPKDTVGLLIDDPEADAYRPLIGARATFESGA